jgi:leucyl/phenylalanyl-tRNA--protein transferase
VKSVDGLFVSNELIQFLDPLLSHEGIVAIGGPLTTRNLHRAYCSGIFPWPVNDRILPWCCPEERAILEFRDLHIPRRLERVRRQTTLRFTIDHAFSDVITHCATIRRNGESGTWITSQMIKVYTAFHQEGHAHSVEVWDDSELVGGLYGVSACGTFAGESMFTNQPNASKLALLFLIDRLEKQGLDWIDIQQLTPHMEALGAKEIPRDEYLEKLFETQQRKLDLFPNSLDELRT